MSPNEPKPLFDEKFAKQYVGKYVLIGISFYSSAGAFLRQEQIHGVISDVSNKTGIKVDLKGSYEGVARNFPPDIRSLTVAPPGEYTLRETKEVINDPDLLWTWNVTEKPQT